MSDPFTEICHKILTIEDVTPRSPRARAKQYREMIQPVVSLEKLEETFKDYCDGKNLNPRVKPNWN